MTHGAYHGAYHRCLPYVTVYLQWLALLSLFIQIMHRWAVTTNFSGFDFGDQPNGRSAQAFDNWISLGHAVQGLPVAIFFSQAFWRGSGIAHSIWTIPVGYPTYNLIKRLVRSHDYFADSSFASNELEWLTGILTGLIVGAVWAKGHGTQLKWTSTFRPPFWVGHVVLSTTYGVNAMVSFGFFVGTWYDRNTLPGFIILHTLLLMLVHMMVHVNAANLEPDVEPDDSEASAVPQSLDDVPV